MGNGFDWRKLFCIELLLGTGVDGNFASRTEAAVSVVCDLISLVPVGKEDNCDDANVVSGLSLFRDSAARGVSFAEANNDGFANVVFGDTFVAVVAVVAGTSLDAIRIGNGVTRGCASAVGRCTCADTIVSTLRLLLLLSVLSMVLPLVCKAPLRDC